MGSRKAIISIIVNMSETSPPSTNQRSLLILTITGTIAVLTNLPKVNLNATDKL